MEPEEELKYKHDERKTFKMAQNAVKQLKDRPGVDGVIILISSHTEEGGTILQHTHRGNAHSIDGAMDTWNIQRKKDIKNTHNEEEDDDYF